MNEFITFIVILVSTFILNFFFNKISFLKDKKKTSDHKSFTDNKAKPPFSGGILFLLSVLIFLPNDYNLLKTFCVLIFTIGFFSDINTIQSPSYRFLIQLSIIVVFVILTETFITSVRIDYIDTLLQNTLFKVFFVTFCFLILINGSNFIDGVNTLTTGYFILTLLFLIKVYFDIGEKTLSINLTNILIFSLAGIFALNFFNLLYLGDSGAYLISFVVGVLLINIAEKYTLISPYYVVNLLWYPAYENLFSMIRKLKNKTSISKPDNFHLHQLIFLFLEKKIKNKKIINTATGCTINIYSLFLFYMATLDYGNTKYQLSLIFMSLLIYNTSYVLLKTNTSKR